MSLNCLQVLSDYAGFLNANPLTQMTDANGNPNPNPVTGVRPHPLFFSGTNCSGRQWPPREQEPVDGESIANPATTPFAFGSLYIPPGWTVEFTDKQNNKGVYPQQGSNLPILLASTEGVTLGNNAFGIANNIASVKIFYPRYDGSADRVYSLDQWKLDMCLNRVSTLVGSQQLLSWHGGSNECDQFMTAYCKPVADLTCATNSTEIAPLADKFRPCACLVEQNCIRDTFCQPGSPISVCPEPSKLAAYVPVSCYGKNCSLSGYRWAYMQKQPCNITLCNQVINLVGKDIVRKGSANLWCGNKSIAVEPAPSVTPIPTVTPTPVDPNASTSADMPTWSWLLIGIAIFAIAVALPLAIIVYRQAATRNRPKSMTLADPALRNSVPSDVEY